jgi:porphobilinogen synthase
MFPVKRMRRLRDNKSLRSMLQQVNLEPRQLVYPIFIAEKLQEPAEISSMPGQWHWPIDKCHEPVEKALKYGVKSFLLFGIPALKDQLGTSALSSNSVVCKAIKHLKKHCPEAYLISDICLCAYTSHGHCGVIKDEGVNNDESLELLVKMSLAHANAGVDMVAPSDMMDGRVGAIRLALDEAGFEGLPIMSYGAKYASSFYGPFREAADSAPSKGDRRGYQMSFTNFASEAMEELALDLEEGADILMVKPGLAYLDVLREARQIFNCPLAVYQVSGEYSMIKAGAEKGWINEREVVLETLFAMRRAGADLIITYFAPEIKDWL